MLKDIKESIIIAGIMTAFIVILTIIFGNTGSGFIRNFMIFIIGTIIGTPIAIILKFLGKYFSRLFMRGEHENVLTYGGFIMGAVIGVALASSLFSDKFETSYMYQCVVNRGLSKSQCQCIYDKLYDKYDDSLEFTLLHKGSNQNVQNFILKSIIKCTKSEILQNDNIMQDYKDSFSNKKINSTTQSIPPTKTENILDSKTNDKMEKVEINELLNELKNHIRDDNKIAISNMIKYPLNRKAPIHSIQNKQELIDEFESIFDTKLKNIILNATEKDLDKMGGRGTMLKNGLIWFRDGKIIAINYQSEKEKNLMKEINKSDKNLIYKSLANFKTNKLIFLTKRFKIRIDLLENLTFRYASWSKQENQNQKPNLILKNGEIIFDGSGGNYYYIFKNKEYKYIIYINVIGVDDFIGNLKVYKNNKIILNHKITKLLNQVQ